MGRATLMLASNVVIITDVFVVLIKYHLDIRHGNIAVLGIPKPPLCLI